MSILAGPKKYVIVNHDDENHDNRIHEDDLSRARELAKELSMQVHLKTPWHKHPPTIGIYDTDGALIAEYCAGRLAA